MFNTQTYSGAVCDELFTLVTGVGVQTVVTRDTMGNIIHLDVFLAKQRLFTALAVERLRHDSL